MTSQENTPSKNLYKFFSHLQAIPYLGQKMLLIGFAYLIITFGQPAFLPWLGPLAATCGFALFFLQTANLSPIKRFMSGFSFFFLVQTVQLWWFTSHPFYYIWAVYFVLCTLMGLHFITIGFSEEPFFCSRLPFLSRPMDTIRMEQALVAFRFLL
jgi:apolipoprotein N-acyltransferase